MSMMWGLLGPEQLGGERRTRTLDLGAAVREYNERAVPGMGGVWYAKQLLLAMLGIALAQKLRERQINVSNITVANAIEALGCYFALKHNQGQGDSACGVRKSCAARPILISRRCANLAFMSASQCAWALARRC